MPAHTHQWEPWWTTSDQHGLCSPAPDGIIYYYQRRCEIAGCLAVEYAERVEPVGHHALDDKGQSDEHRYPKISPDATRWEDTETD